MVKVSMFKVSMFKVSMLRATPSEGGKRRYPAHFLRKLTDADSENQESQHWIDTAKACEYITVDEADAWFDKTESIGRLLGAMMAKYESFCR